MVSSGRFNRMYHAAVTEEVLKVKRHSSASETLKKIPNIVLQCYFFVPFFLRKKTMYSLCMLYMDSICIAVFYRNTIHKLATMAKK